ncbi:MAG TPA: hypothetical protein VK619_18070 [Pyrinomonadaceae bacterium]|nr:hypothetical protein [Pyrinomonadaceae bacterium]
MRLTIITIIISLALGLAERSCEAKGVQLGREFKIKMGQNVGFREEGLRVEFKSVPEDSRCPQGVQCIQAGRARISLNLSKANGDSDSVELSTELNGQSATSMGYEIKLVKLEPYPRANQNINKNSYVATLVVTRR